MYASFMCGIAGFVDPRGMVRDPRGALAVMSAPLAHRGPDDEGIAWDERSRVGLAHRRLSIIDLSAAGHQPMVSASGRHTLVFNGEIYNAPELRRDLDRLTSPAWRGRSDSEVMLAAIDRWGCLEAVRQFNGMFAFAVFDQERRVLTLARDGVGKKPLVMGWFGGVFAFASELSALRALARVLQVGALEVDPAAVDELLRHGCIGGSRTIHSGIKRLAPGSTLSIVCSPELAVGATPTPHSFWSAREQMRQRRMQPLRLDDPSLLLDVERVLDGAVARRLASDVPLGGFLSGGVDSAIVVALMARHAHARVQSFTIGFDSPEYDESDAARATAQAIGTEHTSAVVTERDALEIVPRLQAIYDEPFADSSQVPTLLLCALARAHVRVALSGDGADELFGGYDRYAVAPQIRRFAQALPAPMRHLAASVLRAAARIAPDELARLLARAAFSRDAIRPREKAERAAALLTARTSEEFEAAFAQRGARPSGLILGLPTPVRDRDAPVTAIGGDATGDKSIAQGATGDSAVAQSMMDRDFCAYLVDDLLVKVDRASMSMALEVRSPFLDREVAEFAWGVPMSAKIRNGEGKWLLRQLADRLVPGGFLDRPKMGFGAPIHRWLRGALRPWAEDLLSDACLSHDPHINAVAARAHWRAFLGGATEHRHTIWALLMYRSWFEGQRAAGLL
jgi:asparagine synthase (glutamine-hydrolysing)